MDLKKNDWLEIFAETGVPGFVRGENDQEKAGNYLNQIEILLNASFPTQRIVRMVAKNELSIANTRVQKNITSFLAQNEKFDFAESRIHNFKKEIAAVAQGDYVEIRAELMEIQRVFQVSTCPEAMKGLLENNLLSAYTIAGFPRKSFIKTYGKTLGGERAAFAIHQRAEFINTRSEMITTQLMKYSHGLLPKSVMDADEYEKAMVVIKKHLPNPTPNYAKLFGSPDICECKHCRSVFSAAAYFVDLLRFLWLRNFSSIRRCSRLTRPFRRMPGATI